MTRYQQWNYWIGESKDKIAKRQKQGIAVPNSDGMRPAKPIIPDKNNN